MAVIKLKNLRLKTIIGAFTFEREIRQELIVTIKIWFEDAAAASSDNLVDTIDYQKLKRNIILSVERTRFHLLESLSNYILDILFKEPLIKKAKVRIDKPSALQFVDSVSISKKRIRK